MRGIPLVRGADLHKWLTRNAEDADRFREAFNWGTGQPTRRHSMRRRTILSIIAGSLALVVAGLAIAKEHGGAQTDAAAATFSATEVKRLKTRTCEGADGTYKITHVVVYGEVVSASDPVLAGKLKLHLKSVYNDTEDLGWVAGKAHIRNETAGTRARASFRAVNVGGVIEGMFSGGAGHPHWRLLANFSANLADTGAVTDGKIGTPSSDNSALLFRGGCKHKEDSASTTQQKLRGEGKGRDKEKP
jgi:hypothetical protein